MLPSPAEKKGAAEVYRMKSNFWLVCILQKVPDVLLLLYFCQGTIQKVHRQITHSSTLEAYNTCLQRREVRYSVVLLIKKEGGELKAEQHHLS